MGEGRGEWEGVERTWAGGAGGEEDRHGKREPEVEMSWREREGRGIKGYGRG